ncbi:Plasmodium exported protein (Pm-fam-a like), unknown function [Plasmodium malariae]|uniref:Fam-l protein n=1 Tax=Plasmodium malariae TaxID=5858 RepID=A0A1A8WSW8_PLAMA|nr:Plasmodium exported protein (Pm-fam-a like), unknown function [Plasmodium malariae]
MQETIVYWRNSIIVFLEEEIPNRVNDKKNISNSEKLVSGEKKQSNGSFPINVRGHKKNMKNKSWIFETKQYSHMEKKIFKELDYVDFLKNNKTISNNTYKKIMYKKCGLRFALPIFLLLILSISFVLDNFYKYGMFDGLFRLIKKYSGYGWIKDLTSKLWNSPFSWLFSKQNKYLVECYNHHRKIYARNYRLLAKYKQDNDSIIVFLEEEIPNRVNDKKNISNSEKLVSGEKKQSNGSFPINVRGHKKNMKNKSWIFETKQYSHMEKKIFKELDYVDFLKNNKTISNNTYKKIMYKKCGLRFALPIFLLLILSISFVLDNFYKYGMFDGLFRLIKKYSGYGWIKDLTSKLWNSPFSWLFVSQKALEKTAGGQLTINGNMVAQGFCGFFIYFVPFIILGIILILGIVYYHKKVKKYEKIKFTKR